MYSSMHTWRLARMLPRVASQYSRRPLTFSYIKQHVQQTGYRYASSSLFISDRETEITSNFIFDHGFEDRLKRKSKLKRSVQLRGCKIEIDQLEEEYRQYCDLVTRRENLEKHREAVAKKMAELVKGQSKKTKGKESNEMKKALIDRGRRLKEEHRELMPQFWDVEEELMLKLLALPSDLLEDVTEEEKVLDEGFQENKKMLDRSHLDVIANCKDIKLSAVGDRAYYLRGRLASLEQELLDKFSTELWQSGFSTLLAPEMIKTSIIEAGGIDVTRPDSVYRLCHKPVQREVTDWDPDHKFLRGVSHLSFLGNKYMYNQLLQTLFTQKRGLKKETSDQAYLARMKLNKEILPLKLFAVGRNYNPACDAANSLPGLYNVTQSNKVSVCGVGQTIDQSLQLLEELRSCLLELYKEFKLPYRLVSMPANHLTMMELDRIELQIWAPSLQTFVKVASLSACGDYSSRRLMISCSPDEGSREPSPYVHMVHGDFLDTTRLIALLLEYDQIY